MTQEEAIKILRDVHDKALFSVRNALETLIPKLAESEDERIRKGLIEALKTSKTVGELKFILPEPTREEAIVYLEKQKEQDWNKKPCITCQEYNEGFEAGRLEGCTAGYNKAMKEMEHKEQKEIPLMNGDADLYFDNWIQHNDTTKRGCFEEGIRYAQRLQKEQKPAEWNANDKAFIKDCANILVANDYAASAERLLSMFPVKPAEWSDTNELVFKDICKHLKEEGYNGWIVLLEALRNGEFQPKPHWKPSEEQMNALLNAEEYLREGDQFDSAKSIAKLYNQLKAL